jgi:hypothetical protein
MNTSLKSQLVADSQNRGRFRRRSGKRQPSLLTRRLRFEPIEPRSMLSVDPMLGAAALPSVGIVATDASAAETLSGESVDPGVLTLSRTGATTWPLTVNYTISGTASNGTDYTRLGASVVIPALRSSATVTISPVDDTLQEGTESVKITLSASSSYTVSPTQSTAAVNILDNDVPDPAVAAVVREVQQANTTAAKDCYKDYFTSLPVNQGAQRGYTRTTPQPDLLAARTAIFNALSSALGSKGQVSYQDFNAGGYAGRNIVATLPGQGPHKSQVYVIGAHYDSEQNPGADDDASGVAGVLEAARVLSKHTFDATLVFVAFDQEEERSNGWGEGSTYFASTAKSSGTDIRGAVVMDMIAYNDGGHNVVTIGQTDLRAGTPSALLAGHVAQAFGKYATLTIQRMTGFDDTDGYSFRPFGFASMTVIEQLDRSGELLNPYYHAASDYYLSTAGKPQTYNGRDYIDFVYATEMTKGVVAWAATDAALQSTRSAANKAAAAAGELAGQSSLNTPSLAQVARDHRSRLYGVRDRFA